MKLLSHLNSLASVSKIIIIIALTLIISPSELWAKFSAVEFKQELLNNKVGLKNGNKVFSYPVIKQGLFRHCFDCAEPSDTKYLQFLTELEDYYHTYEKVDWFISYGLDKVLLDDLIQANTNYLVGFNPAEVSEVQWYIEKIHSMLTSKMEAEIYLFEIESALSFELETKFINALLNSNNENEKENEKLVLYQEFLDKVKEQGRNLRNARKDELRASYKNGVPSKYDLGSSQSKAKENLILEHNEVLKRRVLGSLMHQVDYKVLNSCIEMLNSYKEPMKLNERRVFIDCFKTVAIYLANKQPEYSEILAMRRAVILASTQRYLREEFETIMWWLEARSHANTEQQLKFLNKQLKTNRKNDALKILAELNL